MGLGATRTSRAVVRGALLAAVLTLCCSSAASGRNVYATNYEAQSVSVIDSSTNQVVATIPTGANTGPYSVAITPDGTTAWVANYDSGTMISINTATNQVVGAPIFIPVHSFGLAITPDGTRAYIASQSDDEVTGVNLAARQVLAPIKACSAPQAVTITPDGAHAYVSCSDEVRVVDLGTGQVNPTPIPLHTPYGGAITPDGKTVFIANTSGAVGVIDTATNQLGPPISFGTNPSDVVITPDGARAYVSDYDEKTGQVHVIDTGTRQLVGGPIDIKDGEWAAGTPDGKKVFFGQFDFGTVSGLETATNQILGPITTGAGTGGIAVVPDQSPTAAFSAPSRVRPGVAAALEGSKSSDPDGTVASWAWAFQTGAGSPATVTTPKLNHTFGKPGKFNVTLTVTDNEGCSVPMVFTGQTAYCHGSPAATVTKTVKVAYPGVKVKCPKSAAGTCRFKLKAVAKKGKKLKAQSAVGRAKARPGKTVVVTLKPKKKFAKKLAGAKKTLVQQVVTVGGEQSTKVTKLKIVQ